MTLMQVVTLNQKWKVVNRKTKTMSEVTLKHSVYLMGT